MPFTPLVHWLSWAFWRWFYQVYYSRKAKSLSVSQYVMIRVLLFTWMSLKLEPKPLEILALKYLATCYPWHSLAKRKTKKSNLNGLNFSITQVIRNTEMDNQINNTNVMQLAKFRPHLYGISDPVSSRKNLQGKKPKNRKRYESQELWTNHNVGILLGSWLK